MENLKLFTNETTQTYVRLEQQVTASLNDVILSAENQKQVSGLPRSVFMLRIIFQQNNLIDFLNNQKKQLKAVKTE